MTSEENPDGTYIQKESGIVTQYTIDSEEENEREQLHPEL